MVKYKSVGRERFIELERQAVEDCGLFIYKPKPFLAASPDGLVGKDACLEIKCCAIF